MIDINQLPHISELDNIESDFKVFAGPGAGKTTWLVEHLENVLRQSKRLDKTKKIACITYTNVAADEIFDRLKCDKKRFDISTIHSFLYRNIVKPFSYLIQHDENGEDLFDIDKLDGHDEHIVHSDKLRRWLTTIGQLNGKDYSSYLWNNKKPSVVNELSSLDYSFTNGEVDLVIRSHRGAKLPTNNGELWIYKSKYWGESIMHHEDVLFFSYLILKKSPRILELIQNRFPYIFVDEFQDTTELQTWILNKIGESNTKIGVVGDLAQSIYKFAGAKRTDFISFKKDDAKAYKLDYNHRSTKKIIDFLNTFRSDITQNYETDTAEGNNVIVAVGTIENVKQYIETKYPEQTFYILTRKNTSISEINSQLGSVNDDLIKELYSNDGNVQRAKFIHSILIGIKFHQKNKLRDSLKEVLRPLKRVSKGELLKLRLKRIAVEIINDLKDVENRNKSILDYYSNLRAKLISDYDLTIGSNLQTGKAKSFYNKYTFNDLLPFIKVDTKSDDIVRTIHSAKGTQFKNVLVHFDDAGDFKKYILDASKYIDSDAEDGRIYYVACSRAQEGLIINIPTANNVDIQTIKNLDIGYQIV